MSKNGGELITLSLLIYACFVFLFCFYCWISRYFTNYSDFQVCVYFFGFYKQILAEQRWLKSKLKTMQFFVMNVKQISKINPSALKHCKWWNPPLLSSSTAFQLNAPFFITWSQCVVSVILCIAFGMLAQVMPHLITFPSPRIDPKIMRDVSLT